MFLALFLISLEKKKKVLIFIPIKPAPFKKVNRKLPSLENSQLFSKVAKIINTWKIISKNKTKKKKSTGLSFSLQLGLGPTGLI